MNNMKPKGWTPGPRLEPSLGQRKREDMTFLVGVVVSVDEDRYTMVVDLYGGYGQVNDIQITQPFAGSSSFIAAMPEIGTVVILANQYGFMYPLQYIPNYVHGLDSKNVRIYPDYINLPSPNEIFYRFPKLKKGWLAFGSKDGVEAVFSDRLILRHALDEFVVDGDRDQMLATSMNNFVFAGGVWRNAGVVTRNFLRRSNTDDGQYAVVEQYKDGSVRTRLRNSDNDNRVFTEYLIEVEDMVYDQSPRNEVNSLNANDDRNPAAVFALGNLVGNNHGLENYARALKVGIFNSPEDDEGELTFEPISGDDLRYGMAVTLFAPNRRNPEKGSIIAMDKEGHYYQFVRATSGGGIGGGRSISLVAQGSKKEILGPEMKYGSAWDFIANGGVRWVIGEHNERDGNPYAHRSIDVRTSSGAFYMYGGDSAAVMDFDDDSVELEPSDLRKYNKIEKVDGKERHEVEGDRETIVRSSEKLQIEGMRRESIAGAYSINVGQDMNIAVTSIFSEKVTKEKQETFGSRLTTVTSGDSELEVKSIIGNIRETISKIGFRTTDVRVGGITETIKAGSRSLKITSGNSKSAIKVGNHSISTKSGNVSVTTRVGTYKAKSSVKASMVASLAGTASIEGGSISLKSKERLMGGVVTDKTHFDYITGAPLVGSKSVKAAGLPG